MEAFGDFLGRWSYPTDEYEKLAAIEVEQARDAIRLRLEAKPGDRSTSEIAACLDCTTAKVAEAGAHD